MKRRPSFCSLYLTVVSVTKDRAGQNKAETGFQSHDF